MAVNIGPKIGLDGEAEFRKQINNTNQLIKTLGSEMAALTSSFEGQEASQESLTAQSQLLNKQIDAQKQKLEQLQKGLSDATNKFGEADTRTLKWAQAVNEAQAELNKLNGKLGSVESDLESLGKGAADSADDVSKLDKAMSGLSKVGSGFGTIATGMAGGVAAIGAAAVAGIAGLNGLADSTREYRNEQAKLDTAFANAGLNAVAAEVAYTDMFAVLGDSGQATEASQLLATLADNTQQVIDWGTIATGVYGQFGDSLPVESLIEASNETAKVGEVTGALADALNWVGVSEDEFNDKLAACSTESERTALITSTLNGLYSEAAALYQQNNAAILEANRNQAMLQETMAQVGGSAENLKNTIISSLTPTLQQAGDIASGYVDDLTAGFEAEGAAGLISAASGIIIDMVGGMADMAPDLTAAGFDVITDILDGMADATPEIVTAATDTVGTFLTELGENGPAIIESGGEIIGSVFDGITDALPDLLPLAAETVVTLATALTEPENISNAIEAGGELLAAVGEGLLDAAPILMEGAVNIGANLVEGIWDGITSMGDWISDKISGFFGGLVGDAKEELDINSPSGVTRDEIGYQMGMGVAVGWEKAMPKVSAQMMQSIPTPDIAMGEYSAGMLSGIQTMLTGIGSQSGGSQRVEIPFLVNGKELCRAILSDLRSVSKADPEVV